MCYESNSKKMTSSRNGNSKGISFLYNDTKICELIILSRHTIIESINKYLGTN